MSAPSKLIEKIRKLMALAESAGENEAAVALNTARRLMAENNIEQSDLLLDRAQPKDDMGKDRMTAGASWHVTLAGVIGRHFGVFPATVAYNRKRHIIYYGSKTDIQIAMYALRSAINQIERLSAKAYAESGRGNKRGWRIQFSLGAVDRLNANLRKASKSDADQVNAIVVSQFGKAQEYARNFMSKRTYSGPKTTNYRAYNTGYAHGDAVTISKGVESKQKALTVNIGGRV